MSDDTGESSLGDTGASRGVQSVATALELLDWLAIEPELGVAELGRRLGVAKSTAHRIVTTLCAKGYVQRVPETKSYRLGIRLHELGELVASRSQLRDHALPLLESLRNQTGETVHLAVPEGAQMFYVERLESYHGLRFSSRVGRLRPIHLTSSGKAVAAFNPAVAEAACATGFAPRTARTIRTKQQFLRCLAETRARGYAFSIEEDEPGLSSVAAPVLDHTGIARAAISVAGPVARVTGDDIGQMARRVMDAAQRLMSIESVWWNGTDFR
jgi:DNA-binding IclR family transcriptional regulator